MRYDNLRHDIGEFQIIRRFLNLRHDTGDLRVKRNIINLTHDTAPSYKVIYIAKALYRGAPSNNEFVLLYLIPY